MTAKSKDKTLRGEIESKLFRIKDITGMIFTCLEFGGVGLAMVTGYIMSCLMWAIGPGPGVTPPPMLSLRLEWDRGVATWRHLLSLSLSSSSLLSFYRSDGTGADWVLHVQGHQPLPGQDVIIKTIENINLETKKSFKIHNFWNTFWSWYKSLTVLQQLNMECMRWLTSLWVHCCGEIFPKLSPQIKFELLTSGPWNNIMNIVLIISICREWSRGQFELCPGRWCGGDLPGGWDQLRKLPVRV